MSEELLVTVSCQEAGKLIKAAGIWLSMEDIAREIEFVIHEREYFHDNEFDTDSDSFPLALVTALI